ncbi:MAG TPA: hypothetical protein VK446_00030 [Methylocystis sp.]|nr:hypothetical protein [Methylocystis sp.]
MPKSRVIEFSTSPIEAEEADLLTRLYHEIGLSAVAAALEILNAPATGEAKDRSAFESRSIPNFRQDSLAA